MTVCGYVACVAIAALLVWRLSKWSKWDSFIAFLKQAFSENGIPSSSRILNGWLSVSSMALIWWMVRHAMGLEDPAKLAQWISGLPLIIGALATFAVSPYGVNQMSKWFKKDKDGDGNGNQDSKNP